MEFINKNQVNVNHIAGNLMPFSRDVMIFNSMSPAGCRPFTVSPDSGVVAVGANMQITVEYQSMVVGSHCTEMTLHYQTGQCSATVDFCVVDLTLIYV